MIKKSNWDLHRIFYYLLFVILACGLVLLALSFLNLQIWNFYHKLYFSVLLLYTWYVTVLLFVYELNPDSFKRYKNEKIAVLVPLYNEDYYLFKRSLRSIARAKGNKDIFVIDDGSTKGITNQQLKELCRQEGATIYTFKTNKGKRRALYHGVKKMIDEHRFVVTVDSDTILDEDALIRVVEPLKDPRVGASTGDIRLINEKQNLLTRMVGAYYWVGLNIFKKSQSSIGSVVCCSGCLAAYRSDILKEIIDDFMKQEFLGSQCTHSEDRHLTNLVLKKGYQVKYAEKAISYTHTPFTIRTFLKQQQRWKRGYIRESTYTLSYAWKTRPLLFLQIALCELTIPFFAFGLMVGLLVTIVTDPKMFVTVILPSWVTFMFIRYSQVLFYGRSKIPGLLVYMFFYEIFLYWQFIYALFTVRNKNWITR
jgi:hyaluronan synthase